MSSCAVHGAEGTGPILVQWHRDAPAARGCSAPHGWAQCSVPAARCTCCTLCTLHGAHCTCCTCCMVHAACIAHLRPPRALAEGAQSEGLRANCRKPCVLLYTGGLITSCKRWALTGLCGHLHVALSYSLAPVQLEAIASERVGGFGHSPKLLPRQTCPEQCAVPGTGKKKNNRGCASP